MRRIVTLVALAAVTAGQFIALQGQGVARAQTRELATKGVLLDRVAAVVNDGVVLNSELDDQVASISERLRTQKLELPPQNVLRQQVLERLVLQEIQAQRANRAGLKVPDDALNSALQEVAQRNNIPLSQLPEALSQQGIDYATYREEMRKELTLGLLRQRDVLQRISITPREVDQFLAKLVDLGANLPEPLLLGGAALARRRLGTGGERLEGEQERDERPQPAPRLHGG